MPAGYGVAGGSPAVCGPAEIVAACVRRGGRWQLLPGRGLLGVVLLGRPELGWWLLGTAEPVWWLLGTADLGWWLLGTAELGWWLAGGVLVKLLVVPEGCLLGLVPPCRETTTGGASTQRPMGAYQATWTPRECGTEGSVPKA